MIAKYPVLATLALALVGPACSDSDNDNQTKDAAVDLPGSVDSPLTPDVGGGPTTDTRPSGIDGEPAQNCIACHGNVDNAAPPADPSGNTATSAPGVGAHQQHLGISAWHATLACAECHIVPTKAAYDPTVPTHLNGKDDLVWGPLAQSGTFDSTTLTCAGTYCHGSTLPEAVAGGSVNRTPVWNQVDGTWSACGTTCHTNPPGGSHPTSTSCQSCHASVVASFTAGNPPVVTWKDP